MNITCRSACLILAHRCVVFILTSMLCLLCSRLGKASSDSQNLTQKLSLLYQAVPTNAARFCIGLILYQVAAKSLISMVPACEALVVHHSIMPQCRVIQQLTREASTALC